METTMSNVTEFPGNPSKGDLTFMQCPCTPEGVDFAVVAIADPHAPIVAGLLCPECESQYDVVNGIVQVGT